MFISSMMIRHLFRRATLPFHAALRFQRRHFDHCRHYHTLMPMASPLFLRRLASHFRHSAMPAYAAFFAFIDAISLILRRQLILLRLLPPRFFAMLSPSLIYFRAFHFATYISLFSLSLTLIRHYAITFFDSTHSQLSHLLPASATPRHITPEFRCFH
jgi:hypothetical protein